MIEYSLNFLCYLLVLSFIVVSKTPDLWLCSAALSTSCYVPVEGQCSANIQSRMFGVRTISSAFS
jgi:hypothetical protein